MLEIYLSVLLVLRVLGERIMRDPASAAALRRFRSERRRNSSDKQTQFRTKQHVRLPEIMFM